MLDFRASLTASFAYRRRARNEELHHSRDRFAKRFKERTRMIGIKMNGWIACIWEPRCSSVEGLDKK